jgi:glutaredoxin 3
MMAKRLLSNKGAQYEEVLVDLDGARRVEMTERSGGRRTVPQIFIGERHVGGYEDLAALDRAGELDPLLKD